MFEEFTFFCKAIQTSKESPVNLFFICLRDAQDENVLASMLYQENHTQTVRDILLLFNTFILMKNIYLKLCIFPMFNDFP